MPKEEIEITIDEAGEIKFETKGIKGKRCEDLALEMEKAIGKIKKKDRKPEYYEKEVLISDEIKVK